MPVEYGCPPERRGNEIGEPKAAEGGGCHLDLVRRHSLQACDDRVNDGRAESRSLGDRPRNDRQELLSIDAKDDLMRRRCERWRRDGVNRS